MLCAMEVDAEAFLGEGKASAELGAWTLVARAVINLDEFVTKG